MQTSATSEGIHSSINLSYFELNDNPYCNKYESFGFSSKDGLNQSPSLATLLVLPDSNNCFILR